MSLGAGGENVGISKGVSLFVCLLKDNKKWDIPRCVIICAPTEGRQKSWDIPRCVTISVPMEVGEK